MFKDIKLALDKYEKLITDNKTVSEMQISEEIKMSVLSEVCKKCNEYKSDIIKYIESLPVPEISVANNNDTNTSTTTISIESGTSTASEISPNEIKYQNWKAAVGNKVNDIYDRSLNYLESREILREIYKYMTNVYGVCWQQDQKEWYSQYGYRPKTTEIIFNNEQYKSIFDSVLEDKHIKALEERPQKYTFIEIMQPLVKKYNDKSSGGSATSRKVYARMERKHAINWDKILNKYFQGNSSAKKSDLFDVNHKLFEMFRLTVYEMMQEK